MSTPFTVYGSNVAATTLTSAGELANVTGGTDGNVSTAIGSATGYGEIPALGTASAWAAAGSIGAPSGKGWLFDVNTLFSKQFVAGNWTPSVSLKFTATAGNTLTCDMYVRAYAYDTANSTYTLIGSFLLSGQSPTVNTKQTFTWAASSLSAFTFNATQKLYIDCWLDITASTAGGGATIGMHVSTSGTAGITNDMQLITPGYITPFTAYGSNVAASAIVTAGELASTTGGTDGNVSTKIGSATGYGEILALGTTGAWAAAGSIGAPTGKGWLFDTNALFSQQFIAGNWTPSITFKFTAGTGNTLTCDMYVRAYAYDTANSTYTLIGSFLLAAQSPTVNNKQTFTWAASSLSAFTFNATQKLYIDCWLDITASTAVSSATIGMHISTSGTAGVAGDMQLTTPGYQVASSSPILATSPTTLSFSAIAGGANPATQSDTLSETNGVGTAWTSTIVYGSGSGWLGISPSSGTLTANGTQAVVYTCTTGALAAGTYTATVTHTATTGGFQATVVVTFTVSSSTTALTTYLANAASAIQSNANQLYALAGAPTVTTRDVVVGTSLHYGELTSQGVTSSAVGSPYGAVYYFGGHPGGVVNKLSQKFIDLLVGGNGEAGLIPGGPIWGRPQLRWELIETSQGVYDWSVADDFVARLNAANILINFNIMIPPDWRLDTDVNGNHLSTPGAANGGVYASGAATSAFATLLAQRYNGASGHGTIQAFQWNEDWDTAGTNTQRDAASQWFVENWQIVGPIFRQYAPGALLVGPASRSTTAGLVHRVTWTGHIFTYQPAGRTWAGAIVDSHGNIILDALDFHYYRDTAANPDPGVTIYFADGTINVPTPAQIITNFKSVAASHGYTNFDVWCTEFGWNVFSDPVKPNPYVTPAEQSQYIQEVYDQFRKNGGSHAQVWTINPTALVDETVSPPTSIEPKSIVFNVKTSTGTTFTRMPAYTDLRDTYIPNFPNWGGSGSTWDGALAIDVQSGFGWLLDATTLENQQFLAATWNATVTLQATSGGAGSGSLVADIHVRVSKYSASGAYTTIVDMVLAGQTINSTGGAYTTTGTGIQTSFATGDKLYVDLWLNITTNANNDTNQAVRVQKISLDTVGKTGDPGAEIVTPGYQSAISSSPALTDSLATLTFNATTGGANPATQNDTLSETNGVGSAWTSTITYNSGSGWLAISPTSGTLAANGTQVITYTCTTGSLVPGSYSAVVTFTATTGGAQASVTVTFNVHATAPVLATSPSAFSFHATVGGANPTSQNGTLSNTGGTPTNWTSAISYGSGSGWLAILPISGTLVVGGAGSSQGITFSCTTGSLAAGTYTATVTFTATTGGAQITVSVTFVVSTPVSGLTISIASSNVSFLEKSPKVSTKVNQRSSCTFTVLDTTGTIIYKKGQPVVVSDSILGPLYGGYVNNPTVKNLYPQPHNLWSIDCVDMVWLGDKRSSNSLYTNQQAAVIACDQVQNILSQEGVWGNFALDYNHLQTDWAAGGATLTNVVATTNAGDGNPGDGDLELAPAGTAVTFLQETQTDFNAGTTGGGLTSPASGGVTFTPTPAIKLSASQTVPGAGNAYIYCKIWQGISGYPIAANDILHYDVWIPDSCPANYQMSAVDFVCTDGTTLRDSGGLIGVDVQGIGPHPNNDLTGLATNQWYNRRFFLGNLAGKTISYVQVAFEGDQTGNYAAYFRNIYIDNNGTNKVTIFSTTATATQTPPQQISTNGYSALSCTVVTSYERHGYMFSPYFSTAAAGIVKSSYVDWDIALPNSNFTFTITASVDGAGVSGSSVTFQPCTQNGPIPGLLPGQNTTGKYVIFVYVFDNTGNDPTLTPLLSWVQGNVQPSYNCTKSDKIIIKNTQALWNGGTLTNLLAPGGRTLQINGFARNWDDANYTSQTQYGTASPVQGVLNRVFYLTTGTGTDAKSRCDFAGSNWVNFTMECDVLVSAAFNIGLNYRTTNWNNANNTYAYLVDLTTTNIYLSKGSNIGSTGSNVLISSAGLTLSSGNWHRLKIVVNGNSHMIYLDNVLYINVTDSSFTGAGYVGFHIYNGSGSTQTANFDNFGIMAALSGTWVSPAIDIHSLATISNSEIAIQIDPSVNFTLSTFLVEISLNNGASWATCINQATTPGYYYTNPVPGLAAGTNVSNMTQILIRITISASTASTGTVMPDITAVTLTVLGAYNATGTWISPALPLARVVNAATSLVNWNDIQPDSGTSLAVSTSVNNGASYQAIAAAGNAIPNITLQPAPWVDAFTVDSHASYTQTNLSGGGAATDTWDTANSRLVATQTTGIDGIVEYTGLSGADMQVIGDFNYSDSGGLVARMVDTSNCYFLSIADASASANANTAKLYKMVGGATTLLATAAIVFNRNTYHRFILDAEGTALKVSVDGAQLISVTDSGVTAAGKGGILVGVTNGHKIQCYSLRVSPYGQNVSALNILTKAVLTSTDPTVTLQLLDIATLVADPSIGAGALVPSAQYQGTYVSANMDDLNKKSNYWWTITQAKQFIMQAQNATPAPWILQSSNPADTNILVDGLTVQYGGSLYRNRMVLRNVNATQTQPQAFVGNGQSQNWTLTYPVAANTVPTITVNGQTQTIGIKGFDTGKQFYYQAGSSSIDQDASETLLQNVDVLIVTYTGSYLTTVTRDNTGQFPGTTSQAQYAAIDKTSGIVEAIEDLSQDIATANMDVPTAEAYGDSLLQRYGVIGRTATFKTLKTGLAVGQQLPAFIPAFQMNNVQMLVSQVDLTEMIAMINGVATVQYWLAVVAVEGPALDHWTKIFNSLLR